MRLTRIGSGEGTCILKGEVARSFRRELAGPVTFTVRCQDRGVRPMPGPDVWFNPDQFKPGVVVEGFFEGGENGRIRSAMDQMSVVPAARERPWCAVTAFPCDLP